jgi:hypothetical protein
MANEEHEKYNKIHWSLMLFQVAVIILSVTSIVLNLHEVPCLR